MTVGIAITIVIEVEIFHDVVQPVIQNGRQKFSGSIDNITVYGR